MLFTVFTEPSRPKPCHRGNYLSSGARPRDSLGFGGGRSLTASVSSAGDSYLRFRVMAAELLYEMYMLHAVPIPCACSSKCALWI